MSNVSEAQAESMYENSRTSTRICADQLPKCDERRPVADGPRPGKYQLKKINLTGMHALYQVTESLLWIQK